MNQRPNYTSEMIQYQWNNPSDEKRNFRNKLKIIASKMLTSCNFLFNTDRSRADYLQSISFYFLLPFPSDEKTDICLSITFKFGSITYREPVKMILSARLQNLD